MKVAGKLAAMFMLALWLTVMLVILWPAMAQAHYVPGRHNAVHAIQLVWCGKSNRSCDKGDQAIRVAVCESGPYWDWNRPTDASNGQYQGMFQMGYDERRTFGQGSDPWSQARAAHRYYLRSWWYPWECADIIGLF